MNPENMVEEFCRRALRAQITVLVRKITVRDNVTPERVKVRLKQAGALRAATYTRASDTELATVHRWLTASLARNERAPRICVCQPMRAHSVNCPDPGRPPAGTFVLVEEKS